MKYFFRGLYFLSMLLCSFLSINQLNSQDIMQTPSNAYDTSRIFNAMEKARRGEDIVIGVIGGSITKGYAASSEDKNWANLMTNWWRTTFPQANVTLINAGIGGTGSDMGTFRVKEDLLKYRPDFIVIEFSVNDQDGIYATEMMEGLVRQILCDTNHPGVMMLILKQENGVTAQKSHKLVGNHYKIPMVSFADLIDEQIAKDGVSLHDLFIDGLHPVDLGMKYIAQLLTNELDSIHKALLPNNKMDNIVAQLSDPLITNIYEHTCVYNASNHLPYEGSGWKAEGSIWVADKPGSEISFTVAGNAISVLYTRHNTTNRGKAELWVDNGEHKILDAYWTETWGPALVFGMIEEGLDDGEHILHVKIIEERSEGAFGSYFQLLNVLVAGNTGPITYNACSGK